MSSTTRTGSAFTTAASDSATPWPIRGSFLAPRETLVAARLIGRIVKDEVLNQPELEGLMQELLVSHERPRGTRRLDNWLLTNADTIGTRYASELDRHWR